MKAVKNLLAVVTAVCLLIVLFFTAIQLSIFNMDYIDREMTKVSRAEFLGMSEENLHELFDQTLKYLSDERDDLVIEAYDLALKHQYQFGCYGDAILLLDD